MTGMSDVGVQRRVGELKDIKGWNKIDKVISDMEGVAGIVKWQQTSGGESLYEEGRKLYTEEINAAVRGAKAAGATEIVVMDCHGAGGAYDFNSLVPDLLDPACEYVVQREWTEYTGFLESGCDAALFVGMHAMAGTADGVLSHTVSGQAWQSLSFNGTVVGETGINAALCGHWGVPVVLVTGDRAVVLADPGEVGLQRQPLGLRHRIDRLLRLLQCGADRDRLAAGRHGLLGLADVPAGAAGLVRRGRAAGADHGRAGAEHRGLSQSPGGPHPSGRARRGCSRRIRRAWRLRARLRRS